VPWIALYIGLAVLGLAVLGALTFRLWRQVKQFGRDIAASGAKIAAVTDELAKLSPPPGRR
jgi:hypothetical protein